MTAYVSFKHKTADSLLTEDIRAASLFQPLAFDEKYNIFLMDDKSIGFGFVCQPLSGTDEKIQQQIESLLNDQYPTNTQMQTILLRSPDINRDMYKMAALRGNFPHPLFTSIINERANFFKKHTSDPMKIRVDDRLYDIGFVYDTKVFVNFKIPISDVHPTQREIEEAILLQTRVRTTLETVRLCPQNLDAQMWVRTMQTLFNWGPDAAWRVEACEWDRTQTLNHQVVDYENDIEKGDDYLRIGKQYVKCLSAKRKPSELYFGDAIIAAGDMSGSQGGVKQNYMVVTNIIFCEPDSKKQAISRGHQYAVNQASGPLVRFIPVLVDKKNDFEIAYQSIQAGRRPMKMSYHVIVFASTLDEVEKAAQAARNYWRTNRFEIMVDKFIQLPILLNCLPFGCDIAAEKDLMRHKTVTADSAAVFLPIFGEWKGTFTPHVNLVSRNGQLMSFSLHDTTSNMNAVIAAASGSGKSFLTNEIISSYMSEGALVWVIDVGKSYEKICESFSGDFLSFGSSSELCLNPFELCISLCGTSKSRAPNVEYRESDSDDGEEDALIGLLIAMASPSGDLTDFQLSSLRRILNEVWMKHFRDTTVDHIEQALLDSNDLRIRDIGTQLYSFTSKGSYGRFFNGKNNIKFDNQLTVLELEQLKGRQHLQQVVLLQLIYQIQQEMYLGERDRKKLVIVDEAWDLLTKGDVAKFIESGYRRFRKYGGSVIIITQSINDLFNSTTGRAISENSATTLLLGQKPETIESVRKEGHLQLSDYDFERLKTVHTIIGVYSEIFVKGPTGMGIGRLVVNDFQKLLYSTNGKDVYEIDQRRKRGMSVPEAINDILDERTERWRKYA